MEFFVEWKFPVIALGPSTFPSPEFLLLQSTGLRYFMTIGKCKLSIRTSLGQGDVKNLTLRLKKMKKTNLDTFLANRTSFVHSDPCTPFLRVEEEDWNRFSCESCFQSHTS